MGVLMDILNELCTFRISNFLTNYNSTIEVNGILKKDHDGFHLNYEKPSEKVSEVINFENKIDSYNNQKIIAPILILGDIKSTNTLITLIAFSHEINEDIFNISMIFKGVHFKDFEDIKFKEIQLSFSNIDSFIETKNINQNGKKMYGDIPLKEYLKNKNLTNFKNLNKEKISYKFNLNYTSPILEKIKLSRFKLKIIPEFKTKYKENPRNLCIIEDFKISLKYHEEEDFIKIQEDILHLKKFFTLVLGKSYLTEVKGKLQGKSQLIEIYTPTILEEQNHYEDKFIKPLFKFEEINKPSLLFNNWFEKYDKLKSFYDLYFTAAFSKTYAETEFLLYAQALETYCGKFDKSKYFNKSEYSNITKDIHSRLKDIYNDPKNPDGFEDKLRDNINYAYKKSLKGMLRRLLKDLDYDKVNEILNNNSNKNKRNQEINHFVGIVGDTRDYYTHYEGNKEPSIYSLIELVKELKCIVEICFMEELGLTKNEINKITQNDRFKINYFYCNDYCKL